MVDGPIVNPGFLNEQYIWNIVIKQQSEFFDAVVLMNDTERDKGENECNEMFRKDPDILFLHKVYQFYGQSLITKIVHRGHFFVNSRGKEKAGQKKEKLYTQGPVGEEV